MDGVELAGANLEPVGLAGRALEVDAAAGPDEGLVLTHRHAHLDEAGKPADAVRFFVLGRARKRRQNVAHLDLQATPDMYIIKGCLDGLPTGLAEVVSQVGFYRDVLKDIGGSARLALTRLNAPRMAS